MRAASREREDERKAQASLSRLTPREYDVLRSLARGLSDKEIAGQLHVSTETVRTHMVNILSKLEVESRLQALVFALRFGAVEID
jgi:DNA-binding NarL/FixJ family response regulator